MTLAFNPITLKVEAGGSLRSRPVCRASSRSARAAQRKPALKKKRKEKNNLIRFMCGCMCVSVCVYECMLGGQLLGVSSLLLPCGPQALNAVNRLGGENLSPLSHLIGLSELLFSPLPTRSVTSQDCMD